MNVEKNPRALAKMTVEGIDQYPVVEINGRLYKDGVEQLKRLVSSMRWEMIKSVIWASMVDYPNNVCTTLFMSGCNFNC